MALGAAFIEERARRTRDVQEQIAGSWVWPELTLAQWDAKLADLDFRKRDEAAHEADMDNKRATLDAAVRRLEGLKVQGIGIARNRFRGDDAKLEQVNAMQEQGAGRRATIDEATQWIEIWQQVDAAFVPVPGNDLAAFTTLRDGCEAQLKAFGTATAAW